MPHALAGRKQKPEHIAARVASRAAMLVLKTQYVEEDRGYFTPCWIWQLNVTDSGYGLYSWRENGRPRSQKAHRMYYKRLRGPVPPGLELDHRCEQKECVNPDHMEPVTHAVNCQRRSARLRRLREAAA